MTTKNPKPPQVVLRRPLTAVGVIALAKATYDSLANNKGVFPTPNPPLAQFSTDIGSLDTAETATHTRTAGTVAVRDAKLLVVVSDLNQIRAYVPQLVDANPANAQTLATQAGLSLRKSAVRSANDLSAKPSTKVPGGIDVVARLGGVKASHEWQYSTDGKTWTDAPPTLQARTTIPGFTPGTTVYVRHRPVTKTGAGAWSSPVTLIAV